jgi:RNA polymerase sigma-70 factor (ECF subfamily)
MTTPEEAQWLERARGGDRAAFGMIVRQHQRRIHRLATHLTGSGGDADDVVQETFLRAYRAIERFDGRAEIFTWLYRICVNVSLNQRRRNRRVVADLDDPRVPEPAAEGNDPAESADQAESWRALATAVDALSESLRTTLVLACVESLPYKEIAQVLGCSEGTVAWRVHEARRRLRDALPAEGLAPDDPAVNPGGDRGRRA